MAGGLIFQAAVTAIAVVKLASGRPLGWLDGVAKDVLVSVLAETGGSGDDLQARLWDGSIAEIQIKRGLAAGERLWEPLLRLSAAIHAETIQYGVLVLSPDSSRSIQRDLRRDIKRLADGRTDGLSTLARTFVKKLNAEALPVDRVCRGLRIVTVDALDSGSASIQAAQAELTHLCERNAQVSDAWNSLYRDALDLIALRGARTASSAVHVLRTAGIEIRSDGQDLPGAFLARLNGWVLASNATFSIFGAERAPSLDEAWIPLRAAVREDTATDAADLLEALKQYHDWHARYPAHESRVIDCETLGQFVRQVVVVAGPGMGKTTLLKKLARLYAGEGVPVLRVSLSAIATQMRHQGSAWIEALFRLGLDGSGLAVSAAQAINVADWVLLCDGLDECAGDQDAVAQGLLNFVAGHPGCRAIVTTRPIGYRSALLRAWRHYDVAPPDESAANANLGNLIASIVRASQPLHENAYDVARAQLKASQSSRLVSTNPFLIGIAASLIARGSDLGRTKIQLYAKIFKLIDEAPNARTPVAPASAAILRRFLDTLGWILIAHPLSLLGSLADRCAEALAPEIGETRLQASDLVERCLAYWQGVGMLERVHHAGEETITFIHKTLGEFAAARYLAAMPPEAQSTAITAIVNADEWSEVTGFANSLGLATPICAALILSHAPSTGGVRAVARALTLTAEADVPPDAALRRQVIGYAFDYVRSERKSWAYSVGDDLVAVARRFPEEIGPSAAALLDHGNVWTRVVAWTCAVVAGREYYDLAGLLKHLDALPSVIEHGISFSLGGGMSLGGGNFGIVQEFLVPAVRDVLDRCPPDVADELLPRILNTESVQSFNSYFHVAALLKEKGKDYSLKASSLYRDWTAQLRGPEGYAEAQRLAYKTIFGAIAVLGHPPQGQSAARPFLHLSAFMRLTGFMKLPAHDVWAWRAPFEDEAFLELVRGAVDVMPLARDQLIADAHRALHRVAALSDNDLYRLHDGLPDVDAPEIDWDKAAALNLDAATLERALHHRSYWAVHLAANLLANRVRGNALMELATRTLGNGTRWTLWAGAALATLLEKTTAAKVICTRLQGPLVAGCEHAFQVLDKLNPDLTPESLSAARNGLLAGTVEMAMAAAELAARWAKPDSDELQNLLEDAYRHWVQHEEPSPAKGGAVPHSPRETILRGLLAIRESTDNELFAYAADTRSNISQIGRKCLLDRLQVSAEVRERIVEGAIDGAGPRHLLAGALRAKAPFTAAQVARIMTLLEADDPQRRWAGLDLLDESYLSHAEIERLAKARSTDADLRVRELAFSLLEKQIAGKKKQ